MALRKEITFAEALEASITSLLAGGYGEQALVLNSLDRSQLEKLERYIGLVSEWTRRINLVSDERELLPLHLPDSLLASSYILSRDGASAERLIDLGSGGGFPGVVLAILAPNLSVTLVDSSNKKCQLLKELRRLLSLPNLEVSEARIEELAERVQLPYDIVTSRAVRLDAGLRAAVQSFLKEGGRYYYLSSVATPPELASLPVPGFSWPYTLPFERGPRALSVWQREEICFT